MARLFRDCEWGVVSPFGTVDGLPMLLGASFGPPAMVLFAAHAHTGAIRLVCADYERLERPRRLGLATPKREPRPALMRAPSCTRSGPDTRRKFRSGGDTTMRLAGRLKKSNTSAIGRATQIVRSNVAIRWRLLIKREVHERTRKNTKKKSEERV